MSAEPYTPNLDSETPARAWAVVIGGFTALFCAAGIWHGFGVFFKPLLAEFGVDRTSLSLVSSVAIVTISLSQLVIGRIIERAGAARTIWLGICLMGTGLILTGFAPRPAVVYLTFSVVMAAGYGLTSLVAVGNVIAQWFSRRRGMAMGLAFSGFSAGALRLHPFRPVPHSALLLAGGLLDHRRWVFGSGHSPPATLDKESLYG